MHKLDFSVRDYECDIQGIVNNSVYQNYLEHARHECLKSLGINFYEMHQKGLDLVVVRAELDYKYPLASGDRFYVATELKQESRIKFAFYQDIIRSSDEKLILKAKIIGACLSASGRPTLPEELKVVLDINL